jgi:choline monooxygenase
VGNDHWFDPDLWTRITEPTAQGSALPNAAYTDSAFFKLEQNSLFKKTWVFAAFAHKLPNVGDLLPVEVAGQPILLAKSDETTIRSFHNVCRHRGATLVDEWKSKCRTIVCPNHSWSYSLSGELLARPHFFGGDKHDINSVQCRESNLIEIRCETWNDWVFVNLDGNAADFSAHIEPLVNKLDGYDLSALNFGTELEFDIHANWKLAIENFIEPYHVFSCHPWLNSFVAMAERNPPVFENHILSCGYEFKETDPARGEGLPYFPNLPSDKKRRGDWYVLFPNFAFEIFPDQLATFVATPSGPDRCKESIGLYFVGDGANGDQYTKARNVVINNWHDLNNEDIGILERMQAGRLSDGFDGGVLSPYWDPVQQHFARLIVESVASVSSEV